MWQIIWKTEALIKVFWNVKDYLCPVDFALQNAA